MKRTVHLITGKHYDFATNKYTVGGIQTYINNLVQVIKSLDLDVIIYQFDGKEENEYFTDDFRIINVAVNPDMKDIKKVKIAVKRCMSLYNDNADILIFTTDTRIIKTGLKNTIAIQHGIFWDNPVHQNFNPKMSALYAFSKVRLTYKIARNLENVNHIVCVDYNFPNWLRASIAYQSVPITVIPNCSVVSRRNKKPKDTINIIFARRLETYRGTRVFADAVSPVLREFSNVQVTVAGTGPDKDYMVETLSEFGDRVRFISYQSDESLKIHADQHLAIVPTIGSEGTSLSLLEAMSSQCAVICSSVGGMTNIVLDGYNGIMVNPGDRGELTSAMKKLIIDDGLREIISENAYKTVIDAFSQESWSEKWKELLIRTIEEN